MSGHGTASGYTGGCRCGECREAWRVYHRAHMHADPERMRKHAERERARRKAAGNTNEGTP